MNLVLSFSCFIVHQLNFVHVQLTFAKAMYVGPTCFRFKGSRTTLSCYTKTMNVRSYQPSPHERTCIDDNICLSGCHEFRFHEMNFLKREYVCCFFKVWCFSFLNLLKNEIQTHKTYVFNKSKTMSTHHKKIDIQ